MICMLKDCAFACVCKTDVDVVSNGCKFDTIWNEI